MISSTATPQRIVDLVRYVHLHGGCTVVRIESDNRLTVACDGSQYDARYGQAYRCSMVDTIEATASAVRDWLGY